MSAQGGIDAAAAAELIGDLTAIVARASAAVLTRSPSGTEVRTKPDGSPVTPADEAAESLILEELARLLPRVPIVSEERAARVAPPPLGTNFLVIDPLDGTREYLAGRDEFTINLALIDHGVPIAGVIAAPARALLWRGIAGHGAERLTLNGAVAQKPEKIKTRRWRDGAPVAAVSRSHFDPRTEAFVTQLGPVTRRASGSAVKFCQLAQGEADVYPRLSTTCEWDVAAGHAVLSAAGGIVVAPDGNALAYGRREANFRVPAFIAWGDAAKAKSIAR